MAHQQKDFVEAGKEERMKMKSANFNCPWCIQYSGTKLRRHMMQNCKYAPVGVDKGEQAKVAIERMHSAVSQFPKNMFFNELDIEDKTFSRKEVCNLLKQWGHQPIPRDLAAKVYIKPTPLAHVNFGEDIEDVHAPTKTNDMMPAMRTRTATSIQTLKDKGRQLQNDIITEIGDATATTEITEKAPATTTKMIEDATATTQMTEDAPAIAKMTEDNQATEKMTEDAVATAQTVEDTLTDVAEHDDDQDTLCQISAEEINDNEQQQIHKEGPNPTLKRKVKRVLTSSSEEEITKKAIKKRECDNVHTYKYMTGLKGHLSQSGWYTVTQKYADNRVFELFEKFYEYQDKPWISHVRNTTRLLYNMGGRQDTFTTECITRENYERVALYLEKEGADANTILNYVKSFQHFLKFYSSDMDIRLEETDIQEYRRLRLMQDHMKLILRAIKRKVQEEQRLRKATTELPPSPYEIQRVIRAARSKFNNLMSRAGNGEELRKNDVSFINRYFAAYICLSQGSRPAVIQNLKVEEYVQGINKPPVTTDGKKTFVVMVGKHKFSAVNDAFIVLTEEWKRNMDTYLHHVRGPIAARATEDNFFLQNDGRPFTKISYGIMQLHQQFQLEPFTCTDARRSYESHSSRLDNNVQRLVTDFLCHSEKVAKSHYKYGATSGAAETFNVLMGIVEHYKSNGRDHLPETRDLHVKTTTEEEQPADRPTTSKRGGTYHTEYIRKLAKELNEETRPNRTATETYAEYIARTKTDLDSITATEDDTASQERPDARTPPKLKTPPQKSPGQTLQKKTEELARILTEKYGDIVDATIPTPAEIVEQFVIKKDAATTVHRKLRYLHYRAAIQKISRALLEKKAKKKGVQIWELKKPPTVIEHSDYSKIYTRKVEIILLRREMESTLKERKTTKAMTEQELINYVSTQQWKGLTITSPEGKSDGVFTIKNFKKGERICDYHGILRKAKKGEKLLKTLPDDDVNYILFFRNKKGNKMCIVATTGCDCHNKEAFKWTFGRNIKHSSKPNTEVRRGEVQGKERVFFHALRDITSGEELTFYYTE